MKKKNLYSLKFISRSIPLIILMVFLGCASEPPMQASPAEPAQPTWLTKVPRQRHIEAIPAEPAQPTAKTAAPAVEAKAQEPAKAAPTEAQQATPAKAPAQITPAEPPAQPTAKTAAPAVEAKAQEPAKAAPAEAQQTAPAKAPAPAKKPVVAKEKVSPYLDPKDPKSILYLNAKGQLVGTGDPTKSGPASESIRIGAGWHPEALAAAVLPKDRYGLVDWAKAVKENIIEPRSTLDDDVQEKPPLDVNVVIETKSDFINNVLFPHYIHTWWLKCEVCHPKIFSDIKGQTQMTMSEIAQGKFCGRCHGKVSFPLTDCKRCHTQPKKATQQ